ncbi:hypothetical protein [Streptomyces sp. SID161]|uniref:hypothetical protein n=1 Tax=Streptomyces sp. SID161 TaxID=2690251 RepID=UPI0013F806B2|nr:hypothetical protein [Streptomyces sp. SID161]MYW49601.1 hypothetical protein [Streptomyces sp. SID161]
MEHDDDPTVTHLWMRWLHRLREWAEKNAARVKRMAKRHGRDVKAQIIRGVSYGVGSGAVSLILVWWEHQH